VLVSQVHLLTLLQGFLAASLLKAKITAFPQIFNFSEFGENTDLFAANKLFLRL